MYHLTMALVMFLMTKKIKLTKHFSICPNQCTHNPRNICLFLSTRYLVSNCYIIPMSLKKGIFFLPSFMDFFQLLYRKKWL